MDDECATPAAAAGISMQPDLQLEGNVSSKDREEAEVESESATTTCAFSGGEGKEPNDKGDKIEDALIAAHDAVETYDTAEGLAAVGTAKKPRHKFIKGGKDGKGSRALAHQQ